MPEWLTTILEDWPFFWVFLFFAVGAAARSQMMYWIGRGATEGAAHTRFARLLTGEHMARARKGIERWGMPLIPLSFLTVGFQSAVQATAGVLRINWLRYSLWAVPGWLAWGLVYSAGGTVALWAIIELAARSPWTLVAIVVLGAATAAVVLLRRRGRLSAVDSLPAKDA